MNKKIKELAEQAGLISLEYNGFDRTTLTEAENKFAELLIREYSYDVMNLTCMPDHVEMAARHWGVEL